MGALVAMCSSSQLLQDAAYPRLYKHVCLDVNDIHQVIGFMSGIASHKSRHVRALTIAPSSYVTGTTPSRMLERIVRSLRNLRLFR